MIAMWCILDKFTILTLHFFYFYLIFIFVINYIPTFKKHRVNFWSSVCPHSIYFFLGSCLFQFFENLVCTHTACQQLLQHRFGFCLFRFFCDFGICFRLLCFQFDNFLVNDFQRCFLLFPGQLSENQCWQ